MCVCVRECERVCESCIFQTTTVQNVLPGIGFPRESEPSLEKIGFGPLQCGIEGEYVPVFTF